MKALTNKVIVKYTKPEKKSVLAGDEKLTLSGEVVSIGRMSDIKKDIEIGDFVAFSEYAGKRTKVGSEVFLVLEQSEVLFIY